MAKTSIFTKGFVVVGSMLLGSIIGGFVVVSATPTSVTTCASKATGMMRYAKSGSCQKGETKVVLGQQGPAGATGPAGAYTGTVTVRNITTSSDTLSLSDAGKLLVFSVHTEVTVPADASVGFPIGTRIEIARTTGSPHFVGATGVTVNAISRPGFASMDSGDYQQAVLYKIAANTWVLLADLN